MFSSLLTTKDIHTIEDSTTIVSKQLITSTGLCIVHKWKLKRFNLLKFSVCCPHRRPVCWLTTCIDRQNDNVGGPVACQQFQSTCRSCAQLAGRMRCHHSCWAALLFQKQNGKQNFGLGYLICLGYFSIIIVVVVVIIVIAVIIIIIVVIVYVFLSS